MNKAFDIVETAIENDLDALLSLQSLEGEADQGLVQMWSEGSCLFFSCTGS
jgi:hypothetical protein